MKDVLQSIIRGIIKVFIMISIIHVGTTATLILLFIGGHESDIATICLLGCALVAIALLISSYFIANAMLKEPVSKVKKILLRPLCLLLISGTLYYLLARQLYI